MTLNKINITTLLALIMLSPLVLFFSCESEEQNGKPIVNEIRAYLPAPNDSVLTVIEPGTWVVFKGSNLRGTGSVLFNGFPTQVNSALSSDQTVVVLVPSDIPFADLEEENINTVAVVTNHGTVMMPFAVAAPKPLVTSISNEMAKVGQTITLFGEGLFAIKKITFSGNVVAATFTETTNGTSAVVTVPPGFQPGPIEVVTRFGTGISTVNFNDATGMICNFDDVDNRAWDNLVSDDAQLFPGSWGNYGRFLFESCPAGDWSADPPGRGIRINQVQWVPVESLDDPASAWAVKFELYVKNPWSDGTIFIHDWSWGRTCRYEPWKKTSPYKTAGWYTITLPLSNFKTKENNMDGTGTSAATVRQLLVNDNNGTDGKKWMVLFFCNPAKEVKEFDVAIDNIRVVKINVE